MCTLDAVRNRILQLCGERGLTINRLATLSALPPSSIKNILYGKSQNPKLLTIKLICDGLGITLGEFFSTPEFDALDQEIRYAHKRKYGLCAHESSRSEHGIWSAHGSHKPGSSSA